MEHDNPILYGSDGWYDAITGERITRPQLESKINAVMAGVGPHKSWEQAHDNAVHVVYVLSQKIEAMKAVVQRHLQEAIDDQNTVKRMNANRIGDTSHEKYQPTIDLLTAISREFDDLFSNSQQG